ncbi:ABC transporter permease [Paraburkholderia sabiae]|uniref:ABC transporter permease n=1 Tax=Paraburkholderia sabiae TaxID=273251 RepID=A0ABU9QKE4_9BURK|nr:ABC transporter permease [Paraburkholderia sabiae]WJZ76484.1 ABC transporter permease [Paraburkholderia sabiae]CAD6560198.1 Ribose import permease protein RbsC [Paraburkholderia sabiae]
MNILIQRAPWRLFLPIALLLIFSISNRDFVSLGNVYALLQSFALLGLVTLGLSLTMVAGEFDLSVGSISAVAGLVLVKCGESHPILGIAAALAAGIAIGLANGGLTRTLRVSSLVTTLGSMILLNGVAVWLEGGQVLAYNNFEEADLLDSAIAGILSTRSLITLGVFTLTGGMLAFTRVGRDIRAAGSNRRAAEMAGANVSLALYVAFALSGALAALTGALTSISLSTASSRFGTDLVLQAATAAIVGGVTLSGGVGSPTGIALGALTFAILNNGLSLLGVPSATILLLNGGLLFIVLVSNGRQIFPRLALRH